MTVPILHLRSVRYGGKHQSRTLHTTSDPYANSLVLGPNIIFFPRPPLLARPPGIFSPPGLSSLCLLHGRPDGARNRPARFPVSRCSQAIPPVSRSSLALPIHNLELGSTTSPRCAHRASTPKPSLSLVRESKIASTGVVFSGLARLTRAIPVVARGLAHPTTTW